MSFNSNSGYPYYSDCSDYSDCSLEQSSSVLIPPRCPRFDSLGSNPSQPSPTSLKLPPQASMRALSFDKSKVQPAVEPLECLDIQACVRLDDNFIRTPPPHSRSAQPKAPVKGVNANPLRGGRPIPIQHF
jgi:hypothetical protein